MNTIFIVLLLIALCAFVYLLFLPNTQSKKFKETKPQPLLRRLNDTQDGSDGFLLTVSYNPFTNDFIYSLPQPNVSYGTAAPIISKYTQDNYVLKFDSNVNLMKPINKLENYKFTTDDILLGLSLDEKTGEITGSPQKLQIPYSYYVLATPNDFSTSKPSYIYTFTIEVRNNV
jgi:hypothetical protein